MFSLLLAALVTTDQLFDPHRVAESAICEAALVDQVPVGIDLERPLDRLSFSLQWTTREEVFGNPEYEYGGDTEAYLQGRVLASISQETAIVDGIMLLPMDHPYAWPVRRQIAINSGRRFSLAGHQLANGATLTVYPDDGEFLLTVPQDALNEPEIGVLIVRGTCDFVWADGDEAGSVER